MSDGNGVSNPSDEGRYVVRCRGLPWSATVEEIENFFVNSKLKNGTDSIHMTMTREGRPSGEAYIELDSEDDLEKALKCDKEHMGKRYVEVFASKFSEMEWAMKRAGQEESSGGFGSDGESENVVRLRGLPYECSREDIVKFFDGLEVTSNGILMTTDYQGRSSGEAFVQFKSRDEAERALEKNKQTIGHRYIEIFRSSMNEASRNQGGGRSGGRGGGSGGGGYYGGGGGGAAPSAGGFGRRPGPYDRSGSSMGRGYGSLGPSSRGSRSFKSFGGFYDQQSDYAGGQSGGFAGQVGGYGSGYEGTSVYGSHVTGMGGAAMGGGGGGGGGGSSGARCAVHMRGLPFRVTDSDIAEWFSSVVDPVDINIKYNREGKPTGEAEVYFSCEADAKKAMSKDRQNMQHRYVELFYQGPVGGASSGGAYEQGGDGGSYARGGFSTSYPGY